MHGIALLISVGILLYFILSLYYFFTGQKSDAYQSFWVFYTTQGRNTCHRKVELLIRTASFSLENWRQKYQYKVLLYCSVSEAKPVFESRRLDVKAQVRCICDSIKWFGDIYFATIGKKLGGWCRWGGTVKTKCLAVFNCKQTDSQ